MAFTGIAGSLSDGATNLLLEKEETMVYSCFDFYPKGIEQVLEETGMELLPLLSVIMGLCDKGYLREYGKNQYVRMK
jgi:DNA processing protein